jgi:hypothetical protein
MQKDKLAALVLVEGALTSLSQWEKALAAVRAEPDGTFKPEASGRPLVLALVGIYSKLSTAVAELLSAEDNWTPSGVYLSEKIQQAELEALYASRAVKTHLSQERPRLAWTLATLAALHRRIAQAIWELRQ